MVIAVVYEHRRHTKDTHEHTHNARQCTNTKHQHTRRTQQGKIAAHLMSQWHRWARSRGEGYVQRSVHEMGGLQRNRYYETYGRMKQVYH